MGWHVVVVAQALDKHVRALGGERVEEVACSAGRWDGDTRRRSLEQDGAMVKGCGVERLQGAARGGAVEQQSPLDGCGPAQVWQERRVDVEAAILERVEDARRDKEAEGDGDEQVERRVWPVRQGRVWMDSAFPRLEIRDASR